MTKLELRQYVRSLTGDIVLPYLVSDASIDTFIDEANREAFERSLYGSLDSTHDINLVAGQNTYTIDPLIFYITRAKIASQQEVLQKTTKRELDFNLVGWESKKSSMPRYFFMDANTLTLHPTPLSVDLLLLDGYRYPNTAMEVPVEQHESLAYWVMYRFYSIQDADSENLQRAEFNRAKFDSVFGHKKSQDHLHYWNNGNMKSRLTPNHFN